MWGDGSRNRLHPGFAHWKDPARVLWSVLLLEPCWEVLWVLIDGDAVKLSPVLQEASIWMGFNLAEAQELFMITWFRETHLWCEVTGALSFLMSWDTYFCTNLTLKSSWGPISLMFYQQQFHSHLLWLVAKETHAAILQMLKLWFFFTLCSQMKDFFAEGRLLFLQPNQRVWMAVLTEHQRVGWVMKETTSKRALHFVLPQFRAFKPFTKLRCIPWGQSHPGVVVWMT